MTGKLIEQHGFAHIGPSDNGDQTFCHANHSSQKKNIKVIMPHFLRLCNRKTGHGETNLLGAEEKEKEEGRIAFLLRSFPDYSALASTT